MPATCRTCKRMVQFVKISGQLVATENALINVVPAIVTTDSAGTHVRMADMSVQARQLHATLCPVYAEQDRKKRLASEQRAFEREQHRSKGRNYGL
jgi:formylmethanofuran dehydrogenase subunit B